MMIQNPNKNRLINTKSHRIEQPQHSAVAQPGTATAQHKTSAAASNRGFQPTIPGVFWDRLDSSAVGK
ncbi:Hypothetical predicted protein [Cloeon dipterum]|uniref:Uncharacterized protein n=1 Tax=Cloeon dipterum TaxID=197152 RepID=A0A8S1BY06_9INSE|nr:Hypothetical predicted protein [Cloeon dipterum]